MVLMAIGCNGFYLVESEYKGINTNQSHVFQKYNVKLYFTPNPIHKVYVVLILGSFFCHMSFSNLYFLDYLPETEHCS